MVTIKIIVVVFQIHISGEWIWVNIIFPFLIFLVFLTAFITAFMTLLNWKKVNREQFMQKKDKMKWKKMFILNPICANAFYFEFAYKGEGVNYILSGFLEKSRNKLSGYVDMPKWNKKQ
jgi:hypothetical protein